jgi:hypothetical protein
MIESRNDLDSNISLKFNDTVIERLSTSANIIYLRQITQFHHLQLMKDVNLIITSSKDKIRIALISREQYVAQRACDVYVASICQFETWFDLSLIIQSTKVSSDDITILNKRLQWQIENHTRDLRYVTLHSTKLQLVIFTNSFFVNYRDLFSQIDYVICLAESDSNRVNIVHWSSVKCKRVTRSVLAAELYALTHDFDLEAVFKHLQDRVPAGGDGSRLPSPSRVSRLYSSEWCGLNSHQLTVIQTDVSYTVSFQKFNSIHFFWIILIFLWVLIKLTLRKIFILLNNLLDDEIYKRIKEKFQQCNNLCNNSSASKHIKHEFYVFHFIILSFYYNQSEHHFIFYLLMMLF